MKKGFYLSLFVLPLMGLSFVLQPKTVKAEAAVQQVSGIVDFTIDNLNNRSFKCADFANELSTNPIVYTLIYDDDPTFIGEGTGECLSSGLYVTAKAKLLEFDEIIQNTFINNTIGKYDAVLERYLAWARACGDETPFAGSGIVHNSHQPSVKVFGDNKIIYIALAVVTSLASFGILAFMLIRMSKKNNID